MVGPLLSIFTKGIYLPATSTLPGGGRPAALDLHSALPLPRRPLLVPQVRAAAYTHYGSAYYGSILSMASASSSPGSPSHALPVHCVCTAHALPVPGKALTCCPNPNPDPNPTPNPKQVRPQRAAVD